MKTIQLSLFLILLSLPFSPIYSQIGGSNGWSITSTDPVQVHFNGQLVATYNPGRDEAKPFFYPIIGPTGENMTRHWPQTELKPGEADDHIHHRGAWFGLGNVNGFDFWHFPGSKKDKVFGRIVHQGLNKTTMNDKQLLFRTRSSWVSDQGGETVCTDVREFVFSHTDSGDLILDSTITIQAGGSDVLIRDDKEGFWAIRVPPTMRLEGEVAKGGIQNSKGLSGREAWGKRADWVQYHGPDTKGNQAGIIIMDHPSNLRHPTWWHARHYGLFTANPFGQGNFEKETEKGAGDFTIEKDSSLTFRYRTLFYKGDKDAVDIPAAYQKFTGGN